ncbi:MAG: type II secretion system F family protein [Gemmatimonadota bacterium]|nr:type II secretion system F family protein [Gemmatimonadota bacterium]
MEYVVAALVTMSVALIVVAIGVVAPVRGQGVRRRLGEVRDAGPTKAHDPVQERRNRRRQVEEMLQKVGGAVAGEDGEKDESVRADLARAGFRGPHSVAYYYAVRILLALALGIGAASVASVAGTTPGGLLLLATVATLVGWIAPRYWLIRRVRARQKELKMALADTLDLLVVCVEAGLGLNQAFSRVSEEMHPVSPAMSEEFNLVNLEIRAGTPREDALRRLGERTGVDDIRSLAAMLIQTDRFGTSIARALRVHSETLRTKRRQRAEEAAAKTTIKLVFPLVLFIFPAMFVVILGPAIMHFLDIMQNVT